MTKEISNKIKAYSTALILIIFAYHSDAKFYIHLDPLALYLGTFGLAFFFMSSGYFMFAGQADVARVKERSLKRIKTLLLPYLFWNGVFFLYFFISDKYFRKVQLWPVVRRLLFQPYNDVLWYLFTLFLFSLLAWPAMYIMRKKIPALIFIGVLIALVMVFCIFNAEAVVAALPEGWWIVKIFPYAPLYYFGGFIAMHMNKLSVKSFKFSWIFMILSVLIIVAKFKYDHIQWFAWILLFAFPIVSWLALPEKIFISSKFLDIVCEPSFFIYEFQLMAMWICGKLATDKIADTRTSLITNLVVAILFSYLAYYVSKLIIPWVLDIATGFRSGRYGKRNKQ